MPTNDLAARFGIHRATVTAILHRLGVDLHQRGLTDEQVAEACRAQSRGLVACPTGGALRRHRHDRAAILTPRGPCDAVAARTLQMAYSTEAR
jgi:hypothetical protein